MKTLTVGMACYGEPDSVYFTLQALRTYHGDEFDILVIDNAHERCRRTEATVKAVGGRYIHRPDLTGTSKPRDAILRLAETPWVMVCDSHVLFEPGAIAKFNELVARPEFERDLLTGPIIGDDGKWRATHWNQTTAPGLWGIWADDIRALGTEPFDIPMQGLGCFAMARDAWPGFHPLSRGFGGEEGYIHEKVRRAGGRVLCVPQLRWRHRFRDVGGWDKNPTPYPAYLGDHTFNLLVQHRELGIKAEEAIYQDFGKRLQPSEWTGILDQAHLGQRFGEEVKQPARQRIVGIWYTDNTAPPALLQASLKSIAEATKQCWRHDVAIVACGWEQPSDLPREITFVRFSGERKRSHATIIAQIKEALDVVGSSADAVCFLEHDVIYPEWYFQRVGDSFANNPTSSVVSNLDYIGLSAQGWQPVRERHEPMHQLSMRWKFALANLARAAKEAESGSALLEPQDDRSNWVQLPPTPGLGLAPAVHVNHTAGRFTSHGEIVYAPAAATLHPHWGEHRNWWPGEVETKLPNPVARPKTVIPCKSCDKQQIPIATKSYESLDQWYQAAKSVPSDFHEHMDTIRDLAAKCQHVSQIGIWGKPSRIALARGCPLIFVDYSPAARPEWDEFGKHMHGRFGGREWPTTGLEIDPTDLLFIDTWHTASETFTLLEKHHEKVAKYIVIHTTEIFGETGEDGSPGVLHGVRRFVIDHKEWTVIRQDSNNYGLIVLSRREEDRKQAPGIFRKAVNYAKAQIRHIAAGKPLVDESTHTRRMELCLLCPERAHDVCAKCGCPLEAKIPLETEACPADKW